MSATTRVCPDCGHEKHGPGKFEGEPCFAPVWWENADYDFFEGETPISRFEVTAEDVAEFPCCFSEEDIGKVVFMGETDSGFVWVNGPMSAEKADELQAEREKSASEEDNDDTTHEVIVENVGTVYFGSDEKEAERLYDEYAGKYRPFGCDWFAEVTWIADGDIMANYIDPDGPQDEPPQD